MGLSTTVGCADEVFITVKLYHMRLQWGSGNHTEAVFQSATKSFSVQLCDVRVRCGFTSSVHDAAAHALAASS